MYKLAFTKQANRAFLKLPIHVAQTTRARLAEIAADPFANHPNVTKLQGRPGYRLRVGDWRVIYEVQTEQVLVFVLKFASRGEVYR